jgi:hypothetical protein
MQWKNIVIWKSLDKRKMIRCSTFNSYEHFLVNIPIEIWSHILLCCIEDQVLMSIASWMSKLHVGEIAIWWKLLFCYIHDQISMFVTFWCLECHNGKVTTNMCFEGMLEIQFISYWIWKFLALFMGYWMLMPRRLKCSSILKSWSSNQHRIQVFICSQCSFLVYWLLIIIIFLCVLVC